MRKILITNDDGITSDGIVRLAKAAKEFGKVWVIAPDHQCSAMSHRITLGQALKAIKYDFPVDGIEAYAVSGTPADCVRIGILNLIEGGPDVILSGINFGYNCGSDLQFSGTLAAALEGAHTGIHSIALSEGANGVHEVTDKYLTQMIGEVIDRRLPFDTVWNINFPECTLTDFKGILRDRRVARDAFYIDHYAQEKIEGGFKLWIDGEYHEEAEEGTDFRACVDNCISVGVVKNLS